MLDDAQFRKLLDTRARHPERVAEAAKARRRRPVLNETGRLFLVAADHPARGIVKAGAQPVRTAERVARLLSGLTRWLHPDSGVRMQETLVNGAPGLVMIDKTGAAMGVMAFVIAQDRIVEAYTMVNPEKLGNVAGGAVSAYLPRREAAGRTGKGSAEQ